MGTGPRGAVVIDTLRLTAEEAAGLIERGEVSAAELHRAYLDAIAERDPELHAYLTTVDEPRRRRPDRAQGRDLDQGRRDDGGLEDPRRLHPGRRLHGRGPLPRSGSPAARQDEHGRVRDGLVHGELGLRPVAQPVGPRARPRRLRRAARRRRSPAGLAPVGARLRHRRLDQAARGALRHRRPASDVRHGQPRYGIVAFASSLDQVGPITKTVRDCALLYRIIAGRDPADSTTVELPEPVAIPEAEDLKGLRVGVPKELNEAEGIEPGVSEAVNRAIELCRELGADVGECDAPALGRVRAALLLPDRARRRRPRTSPATTASATGCASATDDIRSMYEKTRDEGFGDEPKRRIMLGTYALSAGYYDAYYGQAQKVRTIIRDEFAAALRAIRPARQPDLADGRLPARRKDGQPARDVPLRRAAIPPNMAGLPGLSIPCGLSEGLPGRASS